MESERPGVLGCGEFLGDLLGGRRQVLEAAVVSEAYMLELKGRGEVELHGGRQGHGGVAWFGRWPRKPKTAARSGARARVGSRRRATGRKQRRGGERCGRLLGVAWRAEGGRGGLEDPQRRRGGAGSLPGCHRAARGRRQTGGGLGRAGGSGGLQLGQKPRGSLFYFFFCFVFLLFVLPQIK